MITRLLNRLHRVFNKDPQSTPVVRLDIYAAGAGIEVTANVISFADAALPLDGITLNDLVGNINGLNADVVATLLPGVDGTLLAKGLHSTADQIATDEGSVLLSYPTSLLYKEAQVYSWALADQLAQCQAAERQLYMNSAEDDWLDFWGNIYFDVPRYANEPDANYVVRIKNELFRATQNNIALAQIVKDALGMDVKIRDAMPNLSEIEPAQQANAPGRFLLDMGLPANMSDADATVLVGRIKDLIRKYKAAGTDFLDVPLRKLSQPTEQMNITESVAIGITAGINETFIPGAIKVGAGWRTGLLGLLVGGKTLREQVNIKVLLASDNSLVSQQLASEFINLADINYATLGVWTYVGDATYNVANQNQWNPLTINNVLYNTRYRLMLDWQGTGYLKIIGSLVADNIPPGVHTYEFTGSDQITQALLIGRAYGYGINGNLRLTLMQA